ncbi:uncharacterized protein L969DRAFT_87165 [Mixia osmundae IAM 14324]|nr:uncharacterized protein L969DRAFT_87165 [Mixia osmundae IAM 14324]KEI39219.1 hypothetical protein L969DRAFT_87165 [Mixia osmundae IAM 14324]
MEASAGKLAGRSHISRVWQILYDASAFCTHLGDFTMPYHSGGLTVLLDAGSIEQKPAVYVSEFRKAHRVAISRREATETYNRALIEITIRGERGPLEREDTWTDDDYACCREYATFVFWLYTDQPKYLVGPQIVKPYCWPDVDADASPTCKHSPPGPHSCIIRTNHFVASTD